MREATKLCSISYHCGLPALKGSPANCALVACRLDADLNPPRQCPCPACPMYSERSSPSPSTLGAVSAGLLSLPWFGGVRSRAVAAPSATVCPSGSSDSFFASVVLPCMAMSVTEKACTRSKMRPEYTLD